MRSLLVRSVARAFIAAPMLAAIIAPRALDGQSPQAANAARDLLAADRAFSAAAASTDLISGISAMYAENVIVPAPGVGFAEGKAAAIAVLRRDSLNATSRAAWTPIRAGISADGTHGFTIGFFDITRADGSHVAAKYLAYWVKGAAGWRVAVYRRVPRGPGAVDSSVVAPLLPTAALPLVNDQLRIEQDRSSLAKAEADFSALAQELGLGPAFARFGDPQAMHVNAGPTNPDIVRGVVEIARSVGEGSPEASSPVTWAADHRTIIAPSGDFGINLGFIRSKEPNADGTVRAPFPFFTIWRRAGAGSPWRYIAE